MARDNSPKERQRQQLERKLARRDSYDRILIVSEGSITRERLSVATQRAQALAAKFNARTVPEPFTAIVELVELLIQLRPGK